MTLALVGLADVLSAAGLEVIELDGWEERGQTDGSFAPVGVMWHHDASVPGDSPGVPHYMADLSHPGAQCWVDRAGRWHLVAAGRMWHAGTGTGFGRIRAERGNTDSLGIETDHTIGEAWPDVQLSSLRRGTAAILRWKQLSAADSLCGHKEYRRTNPDPDGLDMAHERQVVDGLIVNPQEDDLSQAAEASIKNIENALLLGGESVPVPLYKLIQAMSDQLLNLYIAGFWGGESTPGGRAWQDLLAEAAGKDPADVDEAKLAALLGPALLAGVTKLSDEQLAKFVQDVNDEADRRERARLEAQV